MSHGDGDVTIRPVTEDPLKSQPIWVVPGVPYEDRWGHIDQDWLARSLEPSAMSHEQEQGP